MWKHLAKSTHRPLNIYAIFFVSVWSTNVLSFENFFFLLELMLFLKSSTMPYRFSFDVSLCIFSHFMFVFVYLLLSISHATCQRNIQPVIWSVAFPSGQNQDETKRIIKTNINRTQKTSTLKKHCACATLSDPHYLRTRSQAKILSILRRMKKQKPKNKDRTFKIYLKRMFLLFFSTALKMKAICLNLYWCNPMWKKKQATELPNKTKHNKNLMTKHLTQNIFIVELNGKKRAQITTLTDWFSVWCWCSFFFFFTLLHILFGSNLSILS